MDISVGIITHVVVWDVMVDCEWGWSTHHWVVHILQHLVVRGGHYGDHGLFLTGGLLPTTGMGLELADSVLPVDVLPDVSFYPYRSTLIMCNILFTPESPSISSTLR